VYVAGVDGSASPVRVTRDGWNAEPSLSPDGRRLAFVHATGRFRGHWRIVVTDLDGRHLHAVGSRAGQSTAPSWSPQGTSIAYLGDYRFDGGTTGPELREVSSTGAYDHPVARAFEALRETGTEVSFSWSPGGDRIAFEHLSNRDRDGKGGIYVVGADGSRLRQLTRVP
jgi:TolB protein